MARNAESVAANWSGGAVGSGTMARGHSDNSSTAEANSADSDPYYQTGNNESSGWEQPRIKTLSNGEVVWDIGGNVWQWVSDNHGDLGLSPLIATFWFEFSSGSSAINRLLFAPNGNYTAAQGAGRVFGGSAGAVARGGDWNDSFNAGLFTAGGGSSVSEALSYVGFRCVFLP